MNEIDLTDEAKEREDKSMIVKGVYSTLLDKFFEDPEAAIAAEKTEKANLAKDLEYARSKLADVRSCYNKSKDALQAEYESKLDAIRRNYEPAIETLISQISKISTDLQK